MKICAVNMGINKQTKKAKQLLLDEKIQLLQSITHIKTINT